MARQTCTDHCSGCGRHFHGLGAFDAHRVGDFGRDRRCGDPVECGLEIWTDSGACELVWPHVDGITVWHLPLSDWARQRAAERAGKPDSSGPPPRSGPERVANVSGATGPISSQDGALSALIPENP